MGRFFEELLDQKYLLAEFLRDYGEAKAEAEVKIEIKEPPAKLLKARGNVHSGQAKRDPESRISKQFWIPAFAGMTE